MRSTTRIAAAALLALMLGGLVAALPLSTAAADPLAMPAPLAVDPLPGQSDQPAPPSAEKLVLDHGHIDAFTPVPHQGGLRLMMKEDITALNTLRDPETVLLHVKPSALLYFPEGVVPGLAGDVYHLPLVQDENLIWPGWETQLIGEQFPGANTSIAVSEIEGPGRVFLWSQNALGGLASLLQGEGYELPATIMQPYPAHTHAAWAFTEPGRYVFTVRADVTATNGNATSTQTAKYVFIVGEFDGHLMQTSTELGADTVLSDPGEPVTLAARVTPGAEGAVEFRDETRGAILGHSIVSEDGTAAFRTSVLQPGEHRIVASFVPKWGNETSPSSSEPLTVTVRGEQVPEPEHDDSAPADEAEVQALAPGEAVRVTSPEQTVRPGGSLSGVLAEP